MNTRQLVLITLVINFLLFTSCGGNPVSPGTSEIKKPAVSFDTDGGTAIASVEVKQGEKATAPTAPKKNEFIFVEWQLDGKTFDFNTPITKNITLKAIWMEELHATSTDWEIATVAGGVNILWYKGKDTKVVIPTTIDDKKVVGLGNTSNDTHNIFNGRYGLPTTNITTVDVTKAIYLTSIGTHAFYNCTALTSITIPDSVTSIGPHAFNKCTALTSITIPDSVTSIGDSAFFNCTALTSITIPDSVTSIRTAVFSNCTSLTRIKISDFVTSIGDQAFRLCTALTSIKIPDSVTSIGGTAFAGCTALKEVTLSNSLTSIGYGAFANCTSLKNITIPNSVTSIAGTAFFGNKITAVTLPTKCTYEADSFDKTVTITGGTAASTK